MPHDDELNQLRRLTGQQLQVIENMHEEQNDLCEKINQLRFHIFQLEAQNTQFEKSMQRNNQIIGMCICIYTLI